MRCRSGAFDAMATLSVSQWLSSLYTDQEN